MKKRTVNKVALLSLCLAATGFLAKGCSCGDETTPGDGTVDVAWDQDDFTSESMDVPYEYDLPEGAEACDPATKYCEGNGRHWCEDGIMHYELCGDDEYCEFGECLPKDCVPGETKCTGDGKIMTCNEFGSGFSEPADCPAGHICDDGECRPVICVPDFVRCLDIDTEIRCNRLGTAEEEIDCDPGYICDADRCRLQICPAGLTQCISNTQYHECNEYGTAYGDAVECEEGKQCFEGACLSLCEMAELNRSSVGCVFYAVDQRNRYDSAPYYIVVGNTNDIHTANITLQHRRGGAWTSVGSTALAPNTLHTFTPDANSQVGSSTALGVGFAFKITSDIPIVAYQLNAIGTCTGEGSMLIPRNALDTSYDVVTYRGYSGPSLFTIIGTVDGTTVQVTPSGNTQGGGSIPAMTAGVTSTITVNENDVAQIVATSVDIDLTGTDIQGSADLAVFTGTYCSHVPEGCSWCHINDCTSCDPLEEQLIPSTTWGTDYVALVSPEFNWGYFKVVAEEADTTVTITYSPNTTGRFPGGVDLPSLTLGALENIPFELGCDESGGGCGLAFLQADKPIMLMGYVEGGSCRTNPRCSGKDHCPGNYADPSMVTIPPVEQFMREYIFLTPGGFDNDYVTVIREAGSTVTLDAAVVTTAFLPVTGSSYEVAHVAVADGSHHITSSVPFGIVSWGYGYANSYGYPGGMNLEIINP
ncbi:MAG: IgGFc-binding protein [Pseudomonadota bacterium]